MNIPIGAEVQVAVQERNQVSNDPTRKLNGKTFIVKKRKAIRKDYSTAAAYYELYGAKSKYGIPFAFLEEDLIVL